MCVCELCTPNYWVAAESSPCSMRTLPSASTKKNRHNQPVLKKLKANLKVAFHVQRK